MGLAVEVVTTPAEAVRGMDIVVTSGPILKDPTPTIEPGWLAPGAFASPVDFDSYWQGEALKEIDRLATDDLAQMRYYREGGYFKQTPEPYADLGEIVAGGKPGRTSAWFGAAMGLLCVGLALVAVFWFAADGTDRMKANATLVCMDMASQKAIPWPDDIRLRMVDDLVPAD